MNNNTSEFPTDIQDLFIKKKEFISQQINPRLIYDYGVAISPMCREYFNIAKNSTRTDGDNKIQELKQSYLSELQELGLDLIKYPIHIYFWSATGECIGFTFSKDNHTYEFYFKASHFLPYYIGFYDDPCQKNKIGGEYYSPELPEQKEIARIFKEFFKKHGHVEANHSLLDIPLPIVGDHHGGEDEYPYRVYELLFGE